MTQTKCFICNIVCDKHWIPVQENYFGKKTCDECWSLKMYCPDCAKVNAENNEEYYEFTQME
jgi:hypothetical protein